MLPICNNCGKEISGLAYKYNAIAEVNGKLVKGYDLLMCSKECCFEYDNVAEEKVRTGFICFREYYYEEVPVFLKESVERWKNENGKS